MVRYRQIPSPITIVDLGLGDVGGGGVSRSLRERITIAMFSPSACGVYTFNIVQFPEFVAFTRTFSRSYIYVYGSRHYNCIRKTFFMDVGLMIRCDTDPTHYYSSVVDGVNVVSLTGGSVDKSEIRKANSCLGSSFLVSLLQYSSFNTTGFEKEIDVLGLVRSQWKYGFVVWVIDMESSSNSNDHISDWCVQDLYQGEVICGDNITQLELFLSSHNDILILVKGAGREKYVLSQLKWNTDLRSHGKQLVGLLDVDPIIKNLWMKEGVGLHRARDGVVQIVSILRRLVGDEQWSSVPLVRCHRSKLTFLLDTDHPDSYAMSGPSKCVRTVDLWPPICVEDKISKFLGGKIITFHRKSFIPQERFFSSTFPSAYQSSVRGSVVCDLFSLPSVLKQCSPISQFLIWKIKRPYEPTLPRHISKKTAALSPIRTFAEISSGTVRRGSESLIPVPQGCIVEYSVPVCDQKMSNHYE